MDNNIPDDLRGWFAREMQRVDGAALGDGRFWKGEPIRLETSFL